MRLFISLLPESLRPRSATRRLHVQPENGAHRSGFRKLSGDIDVVEIPALCGQLQRKKIPKL